ncbi:hypothetical protein [Streptomyces sp. NBC_00299]|nr:hypothetical protein [Streptomyces sp. NBC_00299]
MFTHVVDVSVRSLSASTRRPDKRAATFADAMSAAAETPFAFPFFTGACDGTAAATAPSINDTDIKTARLAEIHRILRLFSCQTRPLSSGEGNTSSGLTNPSLSATCKRTVNESQSSQGHKITKITKRPTRTATPPPNPVILNTPRNPTHTERHTPPPTHTPTQQQQRPPHTKV